MNKNEKTTQYAINCLKSCVAYCKQQFKDSGIDWLPTIDFVDSALEESAKFDIIEEFIANLSTTKLITEKVYTTYVEGEDKTIVWHELYFNGNLISTELTGWYCGEPNAETTSQYDKSNNTGYYLW
jgi:hypothetical protein